LDFRSLLLRGDGNKRAKGRQKERIGRERENLLSVEIQ